MPVPNESADPFPVGGGEYSGTPDIRGHAGDGSVAGHP